MKPWMIVVLCVLLGVVLGLTAALVERHWSAPVAPVGEYRDY
jgi:hypothetical protein